MIDQHVKMAELLPIMLEGLAYGKEVKLSPMGISMLPMLRQGRDTVILSPVPERLKKYDLPLYQRDDGKYVLHRIVRAGERYSCVGDNQFAIEHNLRHDQMIALVTAFCRDGKEISVNSRSYRLYCRFWHGSRPIRRIWRGCIHRLGRLLKAVKNKTTV